MATINHSFLSPLLSAVTGRDTGAGDIGSLAAPAIPTTPASSPIVDTSALDPLANEQTFLKLMVAQMRNQDPLNPADSTQFVAQLAQFSQLEQALAMRQDLDGIRQRLDQLALTPAPPTTIPAP